MQGCWKEASASRASIHVGCHLLLKLLLIHQPQINFLVQFIVGLVRPLLPEKIEEFNQAVKDLGGQVGSYIPHSSYLVTLSQRRVEKLAALPCEPLSPCTA